MGVHDFLVIGGGIAGASVAFELAAHGRVLVLERETIPGYHSTGRSAAVFTETYGHPIIRALTQASRDFLQSPPPGFTEHPLLRPRGVLWIGRQDQTRVLQEAHEEMSARGDHVRWLTGEQALALHPALKSDYLGCGIHEKDAMDIDVDGLHQGFLRGLREREGEVVTGSEVRQLIRKRGSWFAETTAGSFSAPILVNAAGAWCDAVALLAGARPLGLVPKKRTVFTFSAPPDSRVADWPMVVDAEEQFYFKPDAGRVLASPADEIHSPPCDARPQDLEIAQAVERIETATHLKITHIHRSWAGLRTFASDKVPVVGLDPAAEDFFWLAGQGGYGIMTSPALSQLAAGLITHGKVPPRMVALGLSADSLSPLRFENEAAHDFRGNAP